MGKKVLSIIVAFILIFSVSLTFAFADEPTDEILLYEITAKVNSDATVDFIYHIQWKVLDDSIGKVEWLQIGVPNESVENFARLSSNIERLYYDSYYGCAVIYFNSLYGEDEIIDFTFSFNCDYMYEIDGKSSGETIYYFVPGWFDSVAVDKLVIKWRSDNVSQAEEQAVKSSDYYTWTTSLDAGETYNIYVCYPNDAYGFTEDHQEGKIPEDVEPYIEPSHDSTPIIFFFIALAIMITFLAIVVKKMNKQYSESSGFASGKTTEKVTRTKIVYYENCPSCGAPREEDKDVCAYCGHSMIKSEEVLKEEEIQGEDKETLKYKSDGVYHYGHHPDTFVRVHVAHVPVTPPPKAPSRSTSSHSSSCAHSSCACACVSCACACACAGGGRAGCSTKNFYSTKLKLNSLEKQIK